MPNLVEKITNPLLVQKSLGGIKNDEIDQVRKKAMIPANPAKI